MKYIDIERLHDLALNGKHYRGQGSTTLSCDSCVNQVLLNQVSNIFCKIKSYGDLRHILPLLLEMLDQENLKYTVRKSHFEIIFDGNYPRIVFFLGNSWGDQKIRGLKWVIVDFIDY
ncbi:hypothetical protein D0962_23225 [Leptolyngbyaceae cyanobacterium CCMR0082]|uniref:Uncharacterized protein n=1 Tax=Adonisia turfae CCMR0082 TaxID=2304604 RepID=A0A6M0SD83_9CYAN|nr:hypothetical protein [Adonisia turfae]NEZ65632.1 hypothetical protein [Adonisia turfae CCMR0082]